MMLSLSLGFLLFISVAFTIQVKIFLYDQKHSGSYFKVFDLSGEGVPFVKDIEQLAVECPFVKNTAWKTWGMSSVSFLLQEETATNLGHAFSSPVSFSTVSPNYFDVTFSEFFELNTNAPHEEDSGSALLDHLYSVDGNQKAILSTYMGEQLGLFKKNSHFLHILRDKSEKEGETIESIRKMKPLAFLNNAPDYFVTHFPTEFPQEGIISGSRYFSISRRDSFEDIPIRTIYFQFTEDATDENKDYLKSRVESIIASRGVGDMIHYSDYRSNVIRAEFSIQLLSYFFSFGTILVMVICFFSLYSSVYLNILEQQKEITIMRTLGMTTWMIYRLYIYESFILVWSSSMAGALIGSFIGWTISIQQALTLRLPIPFDFPYTLFLEITLASLVLAFLSTWKPIHSLMKVPMNNILRS